MSFILFALWCFWLIFHLGASVSWLPWNLCLTVKYPLDMSIGSWSLCPVAGFVPLASVSSPPSDFVVMICALGGFPELVFTQNLWIRVLGIRSDRVDSTSESRQTIAKNPVGILNQVPSPAYLIPETDDRCNSWRLTFSPWRFQSWSSVILCSNFVLGWFPIFAASLLVFEL